MSRKLFGAVAGAVAAGMLVAACGTGVDISQGRPVEVVGEDGQTQTEVVQDLQPIPRDGQACVILPDSDSPRWEEQVRPAFEEAFAAAEVGVEIQNAEGDPATFSSIAEEMLATGCLVMFISNIDTDASIAVIENANYQGVTVIDFDRLTLGGGANYYVAFDYPAIGTSLGEGLASCLSEAGTDSGGVALLNGAENDSSALQIAEAAEAALTDAGYEIADSTFVADAAEAESAFGKVYAKSKADLVGVVAGDDERAAAAVAVVAGDPVPVASQGGSVEALQRVLLGSQCMTVYKSPKLEAQAAAELAAALVIGDSVTADEFASSVTIDTETTGEVPSVLVEATPVFAANVKDVVADGFITAAELCATPELQEACTTHGVS